MDSLAISGAERLLTLANALGLREGGVSRSPFAREERVESHRDTPESRVSDRDLEDGLRISFSTTANALAAEASREETQLASGSPTAVQPPSTPSPLSTPSAAEPATASVTESPVSREDAAAASSPRRSAAVAAYQSHAAAEPGQRVRVIA
jgi:hypothetical protein